MKKNTLRNEVKWFKLRNDEFAKLAHTRYKQMREMLFAVYKVLDGDFVAIEELEMMGSDVWKVINDKQRQKVQTEMNLRMQVSRQQRRIIVLEQVLDIAPRAEINEHGECMCKRCEHGRGNA